jgi:diaminopimelate decarboxylase
LQTKDEIQKGDLLGDNNKRVHRTKFQKTGLDGRWKRDRQFVANRLQTFLHLHVAAYNQPRVLHARNDPPVKSPCNPERLIDVARAAGTPTYVYDAETIRSRCRRFKSALHGFPARLLYAVKANANPAVLKVLLEEVDGLEVVSAGEVELALRLGVSHDRLLFSPNNIDELETDYVAQRDVLFNVGELTLLERLGREHPGLEISVRLNLWVGAGHHRHVVTGGEHSKFGLEGDQLESVLKTADQYGLRIVGVHQHIGSGFESAGQYLEAIDLLLEAAKWFPDLRFINVGGGVGIPYRDTDRQFDLARVGEGLASRWAAFRDAHETDLMFWFEPGRYLVAESGVLLVQATAVKKLGRKTFVGTDSGFNHLLRPILYGAYHEIFNLSNPDGDLTTYEIAGNICESGDLFASERQVQEIREGDVLAIMDTGAYGMAMASKYNLRALPAEVVLDGDATTLVRSRASYSELVDRHLEETRPRKL